MGAAAAAHLASSRVPAQKNEFGPPFRTSYDLEPGGLSEPDFRRGGLSPERSARCAPRVFRCFNRTGPPSRGERVVARYNPELKSPLCHCGSALVDLLVDSSLRDRKHGRGEAGLGASASPDSGALLRSSTDLSRRPNHNRPIQNVLFDSRIPDPDPILPETNKIFPPPLGAAMADGRLIGHCPHASVLMAID